MIVAILSDIHGNKFALQGVCKQLKAEGIKRVLVLGDIVGYYYYPNDVIEILQDFDIEFIKGNHEIILQKLHEKQIDGDDLRIKYGSGHSLALEVLKPDHLKFLFNLPISKKIIVGELSVLMCHGTPWSVDEYLYPNTSTEKLTRCTDGAYDFVVVGHSHYQFAFTANGTTLINAGSVGQSRMCGGLANWAIIDSTSRTFQLRSTKYDVTPLIREVERIDGDVSYLKDVLLRNNTIDV